MQTWERRQLSCLRGYIVPMRLFRYSLRKYGAYVSTNYSFVNVSQNKRTLIHVINNRMVIKFVCIKLVGQKLSILGLEDEYSA